MRKNVSIIFLLMTSTVTILTFQNCGDFRSNDYSFSATTSPSVISPNEVEQNTELKFNSELKCYEISSPSEFNSIKSRNDYCITADLQFSEDLQPQLTASLDTIKLNGQNFSIKGLKRRLFPTLRSVEISHLVIFEPNIPEGYEQRKEVRGILSDYIYNSKLNDIKLVNPEFKQPNRGEVGSCGLFALSINNSDVENIEIILSRPIEFECLHFGFLAANLDFSSINKFKNVSIKGTSTIHIKEARIVGTVAATLEALNSVENISIDIAQLNVHFDATKQNGFGGVFGTIRNNSQGDSRGQNITLKGNFNLKNANFSGGLSGDCGGITNRTGQISAFQYEDLDFQFNLQLDNTESQWSSGSPVGGFCGIAWTIHPFRLTGKLLSNFKVLGNPNRGTIFSAALVGSISYGNNITTPPQWTFYLTESQFLVEELNIFKHLHNPYLNSSAITSSNISSYIGASTLDYQLYQYENRN